MRKYIIHTLTILSYAASIYFLFVDFRLWHGIAALVLLFILYHLSILDMPHFHAKYAGKIFVGLVMIGSVIAVFLGYDWTTSAALALLHIGLWFLGKAIYDAINLHVRFLVWDFSVSGLGIWTVCVSFVPLILGIGMLHRIPIDCNSIRFDQITNYITSKYTTEKPSTREVDLVGALQKTIDTINAGESQGIAYILSELDLLKNQTINQIMHDRSNVQGQVCNTIITEANKRIQQPGFQLSAIFLLFIVIYPVMGVLMYIAGGLGTILLGFLLRTNIYKKSLEQIEAERIT